MYREGDMFSVRLLVAVSMLTLAVSQAFALIVETVARTGQSGFGEVDPAFTVNGGEAFTVLPVDVPGIADDWGRLGLGAQWITPIPGPDPRRAGNAPAGEYVYTFRFTVPFVPDPANPAQLDPRAVLSFTYLTDNDILAFTLTSDFGDIFSPSFTNSTQNQAGHAGIPLNELGPLCCIGVNFTADFTVGNRPVTTFNPTGLDLVGVVETFIPEPTTLLLLSTGLTGVAVSVHKRRKAGTSK
jgi:hypothetical protein